MEIDRSRSLLGVRSSERYQHDRKELYFQLVCFVFGFELFSFAIFSKSDLTPSRNRTFITLQLERCEGDVRENAVKSNNCCRYGHPPLLCQSSVLRVSALKIY